MSKHPIVHIEFSAHNREADGKFYANLFGWNVQQLPEMNYATFDAEGGPGGGFNPVSETYPAGTVLVYVHSDDINTTLTKAESLGGKIIAPKSEIPGVGWFAIISDLTENQVGLLQPLPDQS